VELSIEGDAVLGGKFTLRAGQTLAFIPLLVKDDTKPGAYPFRVKATATVGDVTMTRYGTLTDAVKANFGGMSNPPPELLNQCALGVIEKPPFALEFTVDPKAIEKGKAGKILVELTREKAADGDIIIAPLFNPPTAVPVVKPIKKDQAMSEITLIVQPPTPVGPTSFVFRVATKIGGKDYALIPPPVMIDVIEPKKEEPKKDEPKKDKK
jgi:hypothetical protein